MLGAVTPSDREVSEGELMQYGAMGTIIHGMAQSILEKNSDPAELYEKFKAEWKLVNEGNLGLRPGDANPKGFMDAHSHISWEVKPEHVEVEMFDDDLMLCGTADLFTTYHGHPCIVDYKTSRSYSAEKKLKYFKQLALYSIMKEKITGVKDKYLVIAPLNPKNKCGYGKEIVTEEIDKYRQLALMDLEKFYKLYPITNQYV